MASDQNINQTVSISMNLNLIFFLHNLMTLLFHWTISIVSCKNIQKNVM